MKIVNKQAVSLIEIDSKTQYTILYLTSNLYSSKRRQLDFKKNRSECNTYKTLLKIQIMRLIQMF